MDAVAGEAEKPPKLIVWDLDGTLWDGVLLEGDACDIRPDIVEFIRDADRKGILHSIASRNDAAAAEAHLDRHGIRDLFLHPQIGWGAKSQSIRHIAETLQFGLDAVLFVDDSDFELAEASSTASELRTVNIADLAAVSASATMQALTVTNESLRRRRMYQEDARRQEAERAFPEASDAFMATLDLHLDCRPAVASDLDRAEELINRTNQLNSTGTIFSKEALAALLDSPDRTVVMASLKDRFGDYGSIGLVVLATGATRWRVELILVSCRVLSRGIGPVLLNYLAARAHDAGRQFSVDFRDTGRNRAMKIALMMTGFVKDGETDSFVRREDRAYPLPSWLRITAHW
jgi:FkbH-like protein